MLHISCTSDAMFSRMQRHTEFLFGPASCHSKQGIHASSTSHLCCLIKRRAVRKVSQKMRMKCSSVHASVTVQAIAYKRRHYTFTMQQQSWIATLNFLRMKTVFLQGLEYTPVQYVRNRVSENLNIFSVIVIGVKWLTYKRLAKKPVSFHIVKRTPFSSQLPSFCT